MPIQLMELPYKKTELAPYISERTLEYHYGKHHKGYVDKLNAQIENTEWKRANLQEIVKSSSGAVFNNAAQVWNHNFYWNSITPSGGGIPSGSLLKAVEKSFGSFEKLKEEFTAKALSQFGSGWAWLVLSGNTLKIISTPNADTPLTSSEKPLLTCDVWEHAYYLDYKNARNNYVGAFWHIVNWDFALKKLES